MELGSQHLAHLPVGRQPELVLQPRGGRGPPGGRRFTIPGSCLAVLQFARESRSTLNSCQRIWAPHPGKCTYNQVFAGCLSGLQVPPKPVHVQGAVQEVWPEPERWGDLTAQSGCRKGAKQDSVCSGNAGCLSRPSCPTSQMVWGRLPHHARWPQPLLLGTGSVMPQQAHDSSPWPWSLRMGPEQQAGCSL